MLNLPSIDKHDMEPVSAANDAYQSLLLYRTDDYSTLRYKLLRHLEEAFPNWNRMLVDKQGGQDFGVAFIELFSYMADVLGFYQNCRANEAFLRTATLQTSLIDLCALIDYRIPPGASASALQAFFCKTGQGDVIPAGFKVKTKPLPGAEALLFETVEEVNADASLNQMFLRGYNRSELYLCESSQPAESSVLLDQPYSGLKTGQFVVMTAPLKAASPLRLLSVEDEAGKRRIRWKPGELAADLNLPVADLTILGKPKQQMNLAESARADEITLGQSSVKVDDDSIFHKGWWFFFNFYCPIVFVSDGLRQPANLISVNGGAIAWASGFNVSLQRSNTRVYASQETDVCGPVASGDRILVVWPGELQAGTWIVLFDFVHVTLAQISSSFSYGGYKFYSLAESVNQSFPAGALIFSVDLPKDTDNGQNFTAIKPLRFPDGTTQLTLDKTYEGLVIGQRVVISDGEFTEVHKLSAVEIDTQQRTKVTLKSKLKNSLKIATTVIHGPFELQMRVDGFNRSMASLAAGVSQINLDGQVKGLTPGRRLILESATTAEGVRIANVQLNANDTGVDLEEPLQNSFALSGTTVLGNVAMVSHGDTVVENSLGSGDQSQANQVFTLHRKPTTYVHDTQGATGVTNTLQVFVGDEQWQEVESLAESGPGDHHVMVRIDEDQKMSFIGGDGKHGAAFPTGTNNINVRYRTGLGAAGNVSVNAISVLAAPLPFLQSSRNPVAGNGGTDKQPIEITRQMAPVTVRTMDRAVTVQDFKELALSYPGIDKANARLVRMDGRPVIDLVVATTGGQPLNSIMRDSLTSFLQVRSAPNHLVIVRDYLPVPVHLTLEAHIQPTFLRAEMGVRIQKVLSTGFADDGSLGYFHFDRRGLGEDLYVSDVYALVESLTGVDYLIVKEFHRQASPDVSKPVQDVLSIPPDGVATGGDATDAGIGILRISLVGGLA